MTNANTPYRPRLVVAIGLGVLLLLAAIVAIARQAKPMTPVSDAAVIEIYASYASHAQLLVGPYSRYGWHHPGPMYFYILVPFYVLSGRLAAGLNAGALAINLVSIAVILWVATRAGGPSLGLATVLVTASYLWRVTAMLSSTWNPHVIVLPAIASIVVAAAVLSGWSALLPLSALLATFAVQTHLGPAAVVVTISAVAAGAAGISALFGEPSQRRIALRSLAAAISVLLLLWAIPAWEQVTHRPGNVTKLWQFFTADHSGAQTFRTAYGAWVDMLTGLVRPGFRLAEGSPFRRSRVRWVEWWAVAQLLLLVVTAVAAGRSGRKFTAALAGLLVVGSLGALWSAASIDEEIVDHQLFWISGLGVLNLAVLLDEGAALSVSWRTRFAPRTNLIVAAGACTVTAMGLHQLWLVKNRTYEPRPEQVAASTLADALTRRIGVTGSRPLLRIEQGVWPVAAGVFLNLQRSGVQLSVDDDWLPMFTDAARSTSGDREVVALVGRESHYLLTNRGQATTIGEAEPYYLLGLVDRPLFLNK